MNFEKLRPAGMEEAYKDADPTAFSPIVPEGTLAPTGREIPEKRYPIYEDGVGEYVHLKDDGPRQEVVARLLKGVINVADVVSIPVGNSREHFSKIMPHERIAEPASEADIRADLEVISLVFNDQDRSLRLPSEYAVANEHNLRRDADTVSHFDFAEAELNVDAPFRLRARYDNPLVLEKTLAKLEELRTRFEGEDGKRHFLSIVEASGKHPAQLFPYSGASGSPEELYAGFAARIDRAIAFVTRAQEERGQQAA